MINFTGCTVLITGASSGIGAELAVQLAPHAKSLILVARRIERLEEFKNRIDRPGLAIHCLSADLADEASISELLKKIAATGETINFLINNAGLGDHGLFEASDWSRIKAMLDVNITALTRLTHALLPGLIRRGNGAILNVSSIASLMPVPKLSVYAATKAYVTGFSEGLRAELRGTGVSVTTLCPGPVDTEFFAIAERGDPDETIHTPEFFKVPVGQVAREALQAVQRDRARIIPGWLVAVVMTLATLVPLFVLRRFLPGRDR
ncbi:MAG: Short-chain dehydrogenase/reductase [Chthoniobacteraceae bacterium]|nr:Short-chain dehydrogenase/reductase [Chthoniobacteraceae bacterium]